jgi:membrane-bound inhibitor of C-type lysozyme
MASSTLAAVVVSSAALLIGCAELDRTAMGGGTATLICDGGKTFTVTYQDGYETAIIETGGRRAELTKIRTTLGETPTSALRSPIDRDDTEFAARSVTLAPSTGTTGVRYSDGDNLLLSRGRQATLELDGETYSNCETPR